MSVPVATSGSRSSVETVVSVNDGAQRLQRGLRGRAAANKLVERIVVLLWRGDRDAEQQRRRSDVQAIFTSCAVRSAALRGIVMIAYAPNDSDGGPKNWPSPESAVFPDSASAPPRSKRGLFGGQQRVRPVTAFDTERSARACRRTHRRIRSGRLHRPCQTAANRSHRPTGGRRVPAGARGCAVS